MHHGAAAIAVNATRGARPLRPFARGALPPALHSDAWPTQLQYAEAVDARFRQLLSSPTKVPELVRAPHDVLSYLRKWADRASLNSSPLRSAHPDPRREAGGMTRRAQYLRTRAGFAPYKQLEASSCRPSKGCHHRQCRRARCRCHSHMPSPLTRSRSSARWVRFVSPAMVEPRRRTRLRAVRRAQSLARLAARARKLDLSLRVAQLGTVSPEKAIVARCLGSTPPLSPQRGIAGVVPSS